VYNYFEFGFMAYCSTSILKWTQHLVEFKDFEIDVRVER